MILKIYLPDVERKFINVEVHTTTKVGQIIDELGEIFEMMLAFDYELVVNINGRSKILDRDSSLHEIAIKMNL